MAHNFMSPYNLPNGWIANLLLSGWYINSIICMFEFCFGYTAHKGDFSRKLGSGQILKATFL